MADLLGSVWPFSVLRRALGNLSQIVQLLAEIREGIAQQHGDTQLFREIREGIAQQHGNTQLLREIREGIANLAKKVPISAAFNAKGALLHGPNDPDIRALDAIEAMEPTEHENQLGQFQYIFDRLRPWTGEIPRGYLADFLGIMIDAKFQAATRLDPATVGGGIRTVPIPTLHDNDQGDGEWWFEVVDWFVAAEEARERFVMVSLGASYGAQPVGAYTALQLVNPLPCKLVAVEAEPASCNWIRQHFLDNGIDPELHWIIQAAASNTNDPVLFPVGQPGLGSNNCVSTNEPAAREIFIGDVMKSGQSAAAFENLVRYGSISVMHDLGEGFSGEVKFVSAVTLEDVLAPFDRVDLLECDIQQSEIIAIPPFMALLRTKVRRIHIGTHGCGVHRALYRLFREAGWQIVFNFEPNAFHETTLGAFKTNDGILTAKNPDL
jgi:hypothetical protein